MNYLGNDGNLNRQSDGHRSNKDYSGFTLLEFLIAMTMFLVIGGSVLGMFATNAPYFNRQQNLVGLNIATQNAVSQLQLDLANAGTGYYPGTVIPSWPIGVTITNQPSGSPACNNATTYTYTATCFDKLNILTLNPNTPPANPTDAAGDTTPGTCEPTTGNLTSTFYIQPSAGLSAAQTAAEFNPGDQVLLVTNGGGGGGSKPNSNSAVAANGAKIGTFVITGTPIVGTHSVGLPFNPPGPNGVNAASDDPLGISTSNNAQLNLGTSFCASDWVMKLEPTKYSVDVSTPTDPKLMRQFGTNAPDILAEQIIGFKVGAATWNASQSADIPTYSFYAGNAMSATPSGYAGDFSTIRSVRVTLIGRTTPNPDPTYTFRNTFDGGPYQVVGSTVVINPRNMTMNSN